MKPRQFKTKSFLWKICPLLIFIVCGCGKDYYGIPEVVVNQTFSTTQYHELEVAGGYAVSETGGVAGIIVYNTGSGYVAYDRCSTVNPEKKCAVNVDDTGIILVDPCSGAKYDIRSGMPSKAPAERPLKPYQVRRDGNLIRVIN
ncbi:MULTISPECIES: Rieske (2Fe-2S) protein [Olivibacter]|uniref:Rieske domain-containing protein n=3 Tax=Sphingobacteriaceae TaxID=84566 RepID=F4C189_SPHS2|nr:MULTISPECIES: hypothetical protein [Olivibacter]MCL4641809.1 hypothetical protein [Olivibacter sp. UJ_SKK_5.1]MDM8177600.1 hypothetical protein [Olivibacter sp. 47]MDX3912319.1 hypothetical protein [Pseudosphingobacterium sp.]